jgi:hypothetical protein
MSDLRSTMVVLGIAAGVSCAAASEVSVPAPATNTVFAEHLAALQKRVPEGFTAVLQPPFVVLGDEPSETVHRRATKTVKWAVDLLKRDYFPRDPPEIIDIWLFRDQASYEHHARVLFRDTPETPFGYYSAAQRALIMNISTGDGTLVHEIVHPFMSANFPACPAWFNEGFASLYEASAEKDGHIRGLINWRYKGLEQAIEEGKTISFERLTSMTDAEFYGGTNSASYNRYYAQARYLCYYLQEQGLLKNFYHEFAANVKQDPTGYATLKRILRTEDMDTFRKEWENFILRLKTGR